MFETSRTLSALGLSALFAVGTACAPGTAAKAVRGDAPTAADALGADACLDPTEPTEPWTFDLDTTQRGQLTTALRKNGLVLVSYDCEGMRVVRGCRAGGDYEYAAYPPAWDVIDLQDSDEIRASLSGGAVVAAQLKAEMERGTALVIAHGEIGMSSTTVTGIRRDQLHGESCKEATHFVEVVHFGAFAMQTSTAAELGSAVEIFDQGVKAGSKSSANKSKHAGRRDACEKSSSDASEPIAGCDAVVRVRLVPIDPAASGPKPPPPPPPGFSRPPSCPPGMVRSANRCVNERRVSSFECRPGDVVGCKRECDRGSATSCANLGLMYEKGSGVRQSATSALKAYERACDAGDVAGCTGLAYLYSKGEGVKRDANRAKAVFDKACRKGHARACSGLAQQERVAGRIDAAIPMFSRACRLGYGRACFYEGAMLVEKKVSYGRALSAFERACRGGDARGCLSAGFVLEGKPGVKRDPQRAASLTRRGESSLMYACDKKRDADACETLGDLYAGQYGAKHRSVPKSKSYYAKACQAGRTKACGR